MVKRRRWRVGDIVAACQRTNLLCGICGQPVDPDDASVDHIQPVARGGPHERANYQLAHNRCNSGKRDRLPVDRLAAVPAQPPQRPIPDPPQLFKYVAWAISWCPRSAWGSYRAQQAWWDDVSARCWRERGLDLAAELERIFGAAHRGEVPYHKALDEAGVLFGETGRYAPPVITRRVPIPEYPAAAPAVIPTRAPWWRRWLGR